MLCGLYALLRINLAQSDEEGFQLTKEDRLFSLVTETSRGKLDPYPGEIFCCRTQMLLSCPVSFQLLALN